MYESAVMPMLSCVDTLQVLQQEGWHYELEDKNDPLTYKGVVFNEMKGVYSSPDSLHNRACQQVTKMRLVPAVKSCGHTYEADNMLSQKMNTLSSAPWVAMYLTSRSREHVRILP